jgi:hypothetical protein
MPRRIETRTTKRTASVSVLEGFLVVGRWRVQASPDDTSWNIIGDYTGTIEPCDSLQAGILEARRLAESQLYGGTSRDVTSTGRPFNTTSGRRRRR